MKQALLFSGGWDSVLCAIKNKNAELIFIDYNQLYLENEKIAALKIAKELNRPLKIIKLPLKTDQSRRNFFFILELKRLNYSSIIIGTRNLFPIFDNYKDSNWFSLKLLSYLIDIQIIMPIILYPKILIIRNVLKVIKSIPYNCYYNNISYKLCKCKNCLEINQIQRIFKIF